MPGILATIDVEDLGTEKVKAYRDALSDLTPTIDAAGKSASGFTGEMKGSLDTLAKVVPVTQAASQGIEAVTASAVAASSGVGGILALQQVIAAVQRSVQEALPDVAHYFDGLVRLGEASRDGSAPLSTMGRAAQELADAAKNGVPGLSQNATALQEIATQLQQGIPLTEAQTQALAGMTQQFVNENKEALGAANAIGQLISSEQQLNGVIKESYSALQILSTQMQAGTKVTQLQADALQQLADRAKEGNGFTKQQAAEVQHLADTQKAGTTVTKESAQALQGITREYGEANKAAIGLRESTEENVSAFEKFKLAAAAVAVLLVELGREALNYAKEAAQGAARTEVLGTVMATVSKVAHLSNVEMQIQVERIKALGITTEEATKSVIKFVQAQLKVTDAAKLARVAQDLAVVAGVNSSEAFERLTHAIEAQSVMMLRSFGIVTSLHTAYGEYAKQIGKNVKELDDVDKKQAFLNLVLKEGAKFAGTYEAAMGDVGKQYTSLVRLTTEVSDKIGEGLLPIFRLYVGLITELTTWFLKLSPAAQQAASAIVAMTAAMALFGGVLAGAQLLGFLEFLEKAYVSLKLLLPAFTAARAGMALVVEGTTVVAESAGGVGILSAAWTALVAVLGGPVTATIVLVGAALAALTGAIIYFGKSSKVSVAELGDEWAKIEKGVKPINEMADSLKKLRAEIEVHSETGKDPLLIERQSQRLEAYNKQLQSLKDRVGDVSVMYDHTTQSALLYSEGLDKLNEAAKEEEAVLSNTIKGALAEANKAYAEETERLKGVKLQLKIVEEAHGDVNKAMEDTRAALNANGDAILGQTTVWQDLATILTDFVVIGWHLVKQAVAELWGLLKEFGAWVRSVLIDTLKDAGKYAAMVLPPGMLNGLLLLLAVTGKLGDAKKTIHDIASEMEVMARVTGGDGVKGTEALVVAQQKAVLSARQLRDELARLDAETDPAKKEAGMAALRQKAAADARYALIGALDLTDKEAKAKEASIIKNAGRLWDELNTGMRNYNERGEKLKVAEKIAPEDMDKIRKEIESKLDAAVKVSDAAAKKMATARHNFMNSLSDKDDVDIMKLTETAKYLSEAGISADEYARRVDATKKVLDSYSKSVDPAIRQTSKFHEALDKALSFSSNRSFETALAKGAEAAEKAQIAQNARNAEAAKANAKALEDLQVGVDARAEKARLATADKELATYQSLWEREHVAKMTAVQKDLYEEDKRIRGIATTYVREQLLRDEALKAERAAIDQKAKLAAEEVRIVAAKLDAEQALQIQAQRDAVARMPSGRAKADAEAALQAGELVRDAQIVANKQALEEQLALVEAHRVAGQKILDITEQSNAAQTASDHKLFEAQIVDHERAIKEIRKHYDLLYQFGKQAWEGIASAAAVGFGKMVTGAQSLRDVLKSIWNSLKESFANFVSSMVKQWLDAQAKMAVAANTKGGIVGLFQTVKSFFSKGSGATVDPSSGEAIAGAKGSMLTTPLGGSLFGGAVGGVVGYSVGKNTGSTSGGVASGVAAGAAAGSIGGPVGALVGAGIGAIAGWLGAKKAQEEIKKLREEYVKAKGGQDELKRSAEAAGVSIEKMMNTKNPKEFAAELKKIENGIAVTNLQKSLAAAAGGMQSLQEKAKAAGISLSDALAPGKSLEETTKAIELVKAKLDLIDKSGGFNQLRRSAQLVGFDLKKAFDAKSIEDYNQQMEILNGLLEAQQKRITGLQTAATGLGTWVDGFTGKLDKSLRKLFPSDEEFKKFQDKLQELRDKGIKGPITSLNLKDLGLDPKNLEALKKIVKDAQTEFNTLGLVAATTFGQMMRETGDIVQAMEAVAPSLDKLIALQDKWGFSAEASLAPLLQLRRVIKDNEDIAQSISGITQVLDGLGTAGALTQDTFAAIGAAATANFNELIKRGVDANSAMLLMQPTLQKLWEQEKDYGLIVDDATQALIDQGVQQGIVGEKQKDVNHQILDVLLAIGKVLKADLPDAYNTTAGAAAGAGTAATQAGKDQQKAAEDATNGLEGWRKKYQDVQNAAYETGGVTGGAGAAAAKAARDAADALEAQRKAQEAANAAARDAGQTGTSPQAQSARDTADALEQQRKAQEAANAAAAAAGVGAAAAQAQAARDTAAALDAQRKAQEAANAAAAAAGTATGGSQAQDARDTAAAANAAAEALAAQQALQMAVNAAAEAGRAAGVSAAEAQAQAAADLAAALAAQEHLQEAANAAAAAGSPEAALAQAAAVKAAADELEQQRLAQEAVNAAANDTGAVGAAAAQAKAAQDAAAALEAQRLAQDAANGAANDKGQVGAAQAQAQAAEAARLALDAQRQAQEEANAAASDVGQVGAAAAQAKAARDAVEALQAQRKAQEEANRAASDSGQVGAAEDATDAVKDQGQAIEDAKNKYSQYQKDWTYRSGLIVDSTGNVITATGGIGDEFGKALSAVQIFHDQSIPLLNDVEKAAGAISLGRSPGGLKEIAIKSREGAMAIKSLRDSALTDTGHIESAMRSLRAEMDLSPEYTARGVTAPAAQQPTVIVNVTHQSTTEVNVNALDNANMEEAWRNKIQPEFHKSLETNNNQIAAKIEAETRRYRRVS